jgi:hypothetical protein
MYDNLFQLNYFLAKLHLHLNFVELVFCHCWWRNKTYLFLLSGPF